jgi:hypothetical protein
MTQSSFCLYVFPYASVIIIIIIIIEISAPINLSFVAVEQVEPSFHAHQTLIRPTQVRIVYNFDLGYIILHRRL